MEVLGGGLFSYERGTPVGGPLSLKIQRTKWTTLNKSGPHQEKQSHWRVRGWRAQRVGPEAS